MNTSSKPALSTPAQVLRLIEQSQVLALDLETTGLNPHTDRVRLLSISNGNVDGWAVLDCFEHDLRPLLPALAERTLVCHHAAFDLGFLWNAGLRDLPELICTHLLACLLTAGEEDYGLGRTSLAECSLRYLDRVLPKDLQTSDWSGPLSTEQVQYAANDARVLLPLLKQMEKEIDRAGLAGAADIELRCLPAWIWMAQSGVPFDQDAWTALADRARGEKFRLARELDDRAPVKGEVGLFGPVEHWNWDSPQQVAEVFEQLGATLGVEVKGHWSPTTGDAALAFSKHPLAAVLRSHREQATLLKMYGPSWLDGVTIEGGRLYPGWRQIGTVTGRTSCSTPNLQQTPRYEVDGRPIYRTPFRAPPGRVLVKADYSQLQARLACNRARDKALYEVFATGADIHTATTRALLGRDDVTKTERQIGKSALFALLFGAGAEGLRLYCKTTFGIDLTPQQAEAHRTAFFRHYHGLAAWHGKARQLKVTETRTVKGRRRLLHLTTPDTERLNSPVQGDEADGAKRALALLWERRTLCPGAIPVLFCHDEIVCEADINQGDQVRNWLVEAMEDALEPILAPVPCKVESTLCPTWGG